jgi:RHS repeat-associated protein
LSSISNTPRGFTQHEHLNSVELIHMNGRAFDYNLGRFLSVDPIIQFPTNSQSLNPYSYIMNNPLAGTDPTGFKVDWNGTSCEGLGVDDCRFELASGGWSTALRHYGLSSGRNGAKRQEVRQENKRPEGPNKGSGCDSLSCLVTGTLLSAFGESDRDSGGTSYQCQDNPGLCNRTDKERVEFFAQALNNAADTADKAIIETGKQVGKRAKDPWTYAPMILGGLRAIGRIVFGAKGLRTGTKAINLPSWRKVKIDMGHVLERHRVGGALTGGRDVFPEHLTDRQVERIVRQAYKSGVRAASQGDRVLVVGRAEGYSVEMWINTATNVIETAYPVNFSTR